MAERFFSVDEWKEWPLCFVFLKEFVNGVSGHGWYAFWSRTVLLFLLSRSKSLQTFSNLLCFIVYRCFF